MKLPIAKDLSLPIEAVTEVLGFLGRRGQGKSYAAQRLAELMHEAGAQFVVLDVVGNWWGLRLAANGKAPGIPVPVFGGLHGDVPLEPSAGRLIADLIIDRNISAVLDISQFESDTDKSKFAHDFGERFYYRRKNAPQACHLFLEEAQEIIPQNPQREEARVLHVYQRIGKLGRNFGIGMSILSQRPQEVHKKVLNLTELLFAFQLTGPHERKAVEGWIQEKGIAEDIGAELPKLSRGHPHAWSPSWLKISRVISISEKWTFDASSTPRVGSKAATRELSPIDLDVLRKEMAATIEKAKAADPRELRRQIAELQKQSKNFKSETVTKIETKVVTTEIPVMKQEHVDAIHNLRSLMEKAAKTLDEINIACQKIASKKPPEMKIHGRGPGWPNFGPPGTMRCQASLMKNQGAAPVRVETPNGSFTKLPVGERKVLTACIQFPDGLRREQLTVLTGYKRSSRDTYLQRLRERGLVSTDNDLIVATQDGVRALPDAEPLPTGLALQHYWLKKLPEGEKRILEVLITGHPGAVDRTRIDEVTGYKRSSRDTYPQRLRAKQLIEEIGRGQVKASDNLF